MTHISLNESKELINKLDFKLIQLQSIVTVATGNGFLDNTKATIASYLSVIDEKIMEAIELTDKIFNNQSMRVSQENNGDSFPR